ncbi:MAG TPA: DEAD/DEAH box helicase [Candidatus Obscuribacterales bacterium]
MPKTIAGGRAALLEYFDSWTFSKGSDYAKSGKVRDYKINIEHHRLEGTISGSGRNVYDSVVQFSDASFREIEDTDCSCPMIADCKHTVALVLAYINDRQASNAGERTVERSPGAPARASVGSMVIMPPSPSAAAPEVIAPEVKHGLRQIAQAFMAFDTESGGSDPVPPARAMLAYIILKDKFSGYSQITVSRVSLRKDGSFGACQPCRIDQIVDVSRPPAYVTAQDVQILTVIDRLRGGRYNYYQTHQSGAADQFPDVFAVLFRQIIASGRCYLDAAQAGMELKLGASLPGRLGWVESHDKQWRLGLEVVGQGERYEFVPFKNPWYINLETRECGPIISDVPENVLDKLNSLRALTAREARSIPMAIADLGLTKLIPPPPLKNAVEVRMIPPKPVLTISEIAAETSASARAPRRRKALMVASEFSRPSGTLLNTDDGKQIYEKHDLSALNDYSARLRELGFIEDPGYAGGADSNRKRYVALDDGRWLDFGDAVSSLRGEGWVISADTELQVKPIELDDSNLQFQVEGDDSWWFSLALNISIDGEDIALLPALVSAIRRLPAAGTLERAVEQLDRGGKFRTMLPDGRVISLPFDRMRSILISLHELLNRSAGSESIQASALHAADILKNELLSRARWIGADKVLTLVERLRRLQSIERVEPPMAFKATLRDYQLDGVSWLQFLAREEFGGLLADDMGLGKTVQLLAHICLEKQNKRLKQPFLVVCPTSVLPNWISEAAKFAPELKVVSFHGNQRYAQLSGIKKADVVVTTYPLVQRDIDELDKIKFHGVALDEAQAVKNPATKVAQAVRRLKSSHRFCLTGTPVENHLGELWSQFNFLLPGMLGDQPTFNLHIRHPIEKEGDQSKRSVLRTRIRPFLLRRTKDEVATELPEKTVIVQQVELDSNQCELYETVRLALSKQVREEVARRGFKQSQIIVLDALLKLRQVCCDPRLVKLTAAGKAKRSAKLETLIAMLTELTAEGRKVLVFSQFTSMLALISEALTANGLSHLILTGDTKDRKTPVEQFQTGDTAIFLISLKAGGTGLNLTAADVVIHYDPWWNPAVEQQATDRAHRIGQTKKIFVYKLIAQGTIEQRMIELQDRKRKLAAAVYHSDGNDSLSFSETDLEDLLKPIELM